MTTSSAAPRRSLGALLALALLASVALLSMALASAPAAHAASSVRLIGLFKLAPGSCSGSSVSGTYFRMILKSGGPNGPYLANSDSPCSDQSFTPLGPGTDGGLSTQAYQSPPSPPFDSSGNATAGRITAPQRFFGTAFATGTAATDVQTGTKVPVPVVTATGSSLSADLRAFSATWNKQFFNQGAPKPSGSLPGNTRRATGTYDAGSGHFTLDWTSQIQGGAFDGFTGRWHLEGTFIPAQGTSTGSSNSSNQGAGSNQGGPTTQGGSTTQDGGTTPGTVPQATTGASGAPGQPTTTTGTSTAGAPASDGAAGSRASGSPGPSTGTTVQAATTPAALTTNTVTKPVWRVSWPLVVVAVAILLLGLIALVLVQLTGRRKGAL